jgi:hypothetical protein
MKRSSARAKLSVRRDTVRLLKTLDMRGIVGAEDTSGFNCIQAAVTVPSQVPGVNTCAGA